jgi:hypothetical protein
LEELKGTNPLRAVIAVEGYYLGSRFRSGSVRVRLPAFCIAVGWDWEEVKDLGNPVGIYMEETPGNWVLFGFFRLSSYVMVWGRVVVPFGTT